MTTHHDPTPERIALGARMLTAMRALGWHQCDVARRFGVSEPAITYCIEGRLRVPAHVLDWLEDRARAVAALPTNPEWRKL